MPIPETLEQNILESASWDHEKRLGVCRGALRSLIEELQGNSEDDINAFIIALIKVGVSADRTLSQEEYDLYCEATGNEISPEHFYHLSNGGADPELIEMVDNYIDNFTLDAKLAACIFILCFISSDGKITNSEKQIMARFFE